MICSRLARNGKPCEKDERHRGLCKNRFCPKCGEFEKNGTSRNQCSRCVSTYNRQTFAKRYHEDPVFAERHKGYAQKFPEYITVVRHYHMIFNPANPSHASYKDMPFWDEWNPNQGGSYQAGAKWIIDNLGRRPAKSWSMDIIEHFKGFVPGNLRWADKRTQKRNQQHRMLGGVTEEEFAIEAKRRGYEKTKNTP